MFLAAVLSAVTVAVLTRVEMRNAAAARAIAATERPFPARLLPDRTSPMIPKIRPKKARKSPPMLTIGMKEPRAPNKARTKPATASPFDPLISTATGTTWGSSHLIAHVLMIPVFRRSIPNP